MSRIGNRVLTIPEGVEINVDNNNINSNYNYNNVNNLYRTPSNVDLKARLAGGTLGKSTNNTVRFTKKSVKSINKSSVPYNILSPPIKNKDLNNENVNYLIKLKELMNLKI